MEYRYLHLLRQDCPVPPGTAGVCYCRDSFGDTQERSVGQQMDAAREYAQRWGLTLEHIYYDEERATNLEKRDDFNRMISDLRNRFPIISDPVRRERLARDKPFVVIWWKSNRLGRDRIHTANIKSDLRLRGITLISLVSVIETGNAGLDSVIESVYELQDQELLREISENSRRGLAELVTMRDNAPEFLEHNPGWLATGNYLGIFPGIPPTGFMGERICVGHYKRRNGTRAGELRFVQRIVPNPETWARARLAWEMRHNGAKLVEIMRATHNLLKSKNSYTAFFANEIYTGTHTYGGQRLENFVPALIPYEWWEREQEHKKERSKKLRGEPMDAAFEPRRVGGSYLLSGLLYCGDVPGEEHAMHADFVVGREGKQKRWDFYICGVKKSSNNQRCQSKRLQRQNLEDAVLDCLQRDILTPDHLRSILTQVQAQTLQLKDSAALRLAAAYGEGKQLERQLENLLKAIEEVGLSPSLKEKLLQREAEKTALQTEISDLEAQMTRTAAETPLLTDADLDNWIENVLAALRSPEVEEARQAVRLLVEKIVVRNGEAELYYRFPLPSSGEGTPLLGDGDMPRTRFELVFWP